MKQIIQDLKKGNTILENVPAPIVRKGCVLIKTNHSLVSLGTEKMLVEFGKANFINKARQQPEKVKQVLDKIKSDGLMPTLEAVFNKLDEPMPLGYCNAGEVIAVGEGVTDFKVGDKVASNGHHAEVVCIPKNLCALIPSNVSTQDASFTVIGSIGLQGIRLVNPTMGETVVVIGLGLIGLITAQLLVANGCKVIGFDFDDKKIELAKARGVLAYNSAQCNVVNIVEENTNGIGADAVVITASTKSNEVIAQAANMSRKRGRIVLIGVIGLDIQRNDFYKKELSFQVSCSYGPGRYDEEYEQRGNDYPLPYVRWTQKRNFETILQLLATGKLYVNDLITEKVQLEEYNTIYNQMGGGSIASIIEYPTNQENLTQTVINLAPKQNTTRKGVLGIIGAGNFTKMTVLPSMKGLAANYKYIASNSGLTAQALAKKYGFENSTSDYKNILNDPEVDLVMITTRHNTHAKMVTEALEAQKHVFVEKPLALSHDELNKIIEAEKKSNCTVNVGFNRRFSPFSIKVKNELGAHPGPINIVATMNAGFIPADVWVHDMQVGGGRIVGEACHFIDLCTYFTGSEVEKVCMNALGTNAEDNTDNAIITLKYKNGSQAVINYFSNGNKAYSKERIELYYQGKTWVLDNFRKLESYGAKASLSARQDKGHKNQFKLLLDQVQQGKQALIPFTELVNTTKASFAALESLKQGIWINLCT
jgi:predicted dehydrogenase/threonine dehydrogenase-like Zn-dependent dehydrogenase